MPQYDLLFTQRINVCLTQNHYKNEQIETYDVVCTNSAISENLSKNRFSIQQNFLDEKKKYTQESVIVLIFHAANSNDYGWLIYSIEFQSEYRYLEWFQAASSINDMLSGFSVPSSVSSIVNFPNDFGVREWSKYCFSICVCDGHINREVKLLSKSIKTWNTQCFQLLYRPFGHLAIRPFTGIGWSVVF